jgi:hypothetical protein
VWGGVRKTSCNISAPQSSGYEEFLVHSEAASILEEHAASIFRIEEKTKQESSMKLAASNPEDEEYVPLKHELTFSRLRAMFHKIGLFRKVLDFWCKWELLERKSSGSGLEIREYGCRDLSR